MDKALQPLPLERHPHLLVGTETADDAGVFKLSEEMALVQTVDFITPIVDDPFIFGQIAAANSLSDVYAMGGKPLTAMNVIGFPRLSLDLSILTEILRGGLEKIHEAGAVLVGGHTVEDAGVEIRPLGNRHRASPENLDQQGVPGRGCPGLDQTHGNGHYLDCQQGGDGRRRNFTGGH